VDVRAEGNETYRGDIYGFLTCEPNAEVGAKHLKAMPVILTTEKECETWLRALMDKAMVLQRPLPMARCGSWPAVTDRIGRPV
jgi:putative SOS response-associated peptidase YedK